MRVAEMIKVLLEVLYCEVLLYLQYYIMWTITWNVDDNISYSSTHILVNKSCKQDIIPLNSK